MNKRFTSNCVLTADTSGPSHLPDRQIDSVPANSFKANVRRCRSLGTVHQYGTFGQDIQLAQRQPTTTNDPPVYGDPIGLNNDEWQSEKLFIANGDQRSPSTVSLAGDLHNFSCNDIPTLSPMEDPPVDSLSLGALEMGEGQKSKSVEKLTDTRCNGGMVSSSPVIRHAISAREPSCPDLLVASTKTPRTRLPHSTSSFRGSAKSMERIENLQRRAMYPPFLFPSMTELANVEREAEATQFLSDGLGQSGDLRDTGEKAKLPTLTKRQKLILVMMAFSNFSATVVFSCIAPFFPPEARKKQASETEIGFIFGVFELVIFIASPLLGKYMTKIGSKFMFTTGLFVTGFTSFLFGLLNLSPPGTTFVVLCFMIRIIEAVGDAALMTASFAIIAKEFPGRVATTIGILETFSGLGYSAGPPIGGALYEAGGFQVPFWTLGSLLIIAGLVSLPLLPKQQDNELRVRSHGGLLHLLRIPVIFLLCLNIVVSAISLSFLDPTLEAHLSDFGLSPTLVGIMFLLTGGVYTITAPFWGFLVDKGFNGRLIIIIGCVFNVTTFLFVGPSPMFHLDKDLWLVALSLAVMGLGIGAQLIPPFQNCLEEAKSRGYPENFETYGLISGLFQSSMSFGAFFGPTVGASAVAVIGFGWSTTIIAGIHLCLMIAVAIFHIVFTHCKKTKKVSVDAAPVETVGTELDNSLNDFERQYLLVSSTGTPRPKKDFLAPLVVMETFEEQSDTSSRADSGIGTNEAKVVVA